MNFSERISLALDNRLPDNSSLVIGCGPAVSDTEVTLWCNNTKYVYPPAATLMTLSSSDAKDTEVGEGARMIRISGLNSKYDRIQETVILKGLTGVPTTQEYLRISNIEIVTAGLREPSNVGDIYVGTGDIDENGVPENIYEMMEASIGISRRSCHTVPRGRRALVTGLMVRTERNADIQAKLYTAAEGGPMLQPGSVPVFASGFNLEFSSFFSVLEKTDIEIRALAKASTYRVMCLIELFEFAF